MPLLLRTKSRLPPRSSVTPSGNQAVGIRPATRLAGAAPPDPLPSKIASIQLSPPSVTKSLRPSGETTSPCGQLAASLAGAGLVGIVSTTESVAVAITETESLLALAT